MFLVSTQRRSFISLPCCSIRRSRFTTLAILLLASFILFHQSFQPGFDTDDNFPPPISSPSPRLSPPLAISPSIRNGTQKDRVIYNLYKIGHMPWLDYLEQLDPDGLAPLTKQVQRWIWEKQHPPKQSCSSQRFLISAGTENVGLGAYLHSRCLSFIFYTPTRPLSRSSQSMQSRAISSALLWKLASYTS